MARADEPKPWDEMFRRIRALYLADWVYPPKPTAADLDAVESQLGFTFPASYRAFAEEFGLGGALHALPEVLRLARPPEVSSGRDWDYMIGATQLAREWYEVHPPRIGPTVPSELCERLVVFASDPGYDTWSFYPPDVTDPRWQECRIYVISRLGSRVETVADSFGEWLRHIDERYGDAPDEEADDRTYPFVMKPDSSDPRPMTYRPRSVRRKEALEQQDVARWLSWNNGSVRALALSIREEGRADTFPVLADALEEAGCASEDLLHSCRAGDPDIDGPWVLAVLLGHHAPAR